jgi:hypothetical protein
LDFGVPPGLEALPRPAAARVLRRLFAVLAPFREVFLAVLRARFAPFVPPRFPAAFRFAFAMRSLFTLTVRL